MQNIQLFDVGSNLLGKSYNKTLTANCFYLIRENLQFQHTTLKKSIKRKGHTRTTSIQAFASKYIDRKGKHTISEDNIYLNEISTKELCTYNFNFSSFEKLTSLENCAKDSIFTVIALKDNPINNIHKFIMYLIQLCKFDVNKGNTFMPSLNLAFYKDSSLLEIKLPTIKLNEGNITRQSLKDYYAMFDSIHLQTK